MNLQQVMTLIREISTEYVRTHPDKEGALHIAKYILPRLKKIDSPKREYVIQAVVDRHNDILKRLLDIFIDYTCSYQVIEEIRKIEGIEIGPETIIEIKDTKHGNWHNNNDTKRGNWHNNNDTKGKRGRQ